MAIDHYENFPVASVLLPKKLRPAVEAIYAFARSADDLADEGDATAAERLIALTNYDAELDTIFAGQVSNHPIFSRLAFVIDEFDLSIKPFRDLLSAFRQDVATNRYANYTDLLDYCRRSANPVGRLMLALYEVKDSRSYQQSDAICTALQLINFWQDIAIDWKKNRIYLPLDDLLRFDVTTDQLTNEQINPAWVGLMAYEVARARTMLLEGAPLALALPGRIGWELRLVVQGGLRILKRIEAVGYDIFRHRPQLSPRDWWFILWGALRMH